MLLNHFIIFFLLPILNFQILSQNLSKYDASNIDTINTLRHFFHDSSINKPNYFYNNKSQKWEIFIPPYNFNKNLAIKSKYLLLNDLRRKSLYTNSENLMESYNESIKILMSIGYKDYTKYDLGELGKYLGISRDIMAIILGILTLLKK